MTESTHRAILKLHRKNGADKLEKSWKKFLTERTKYGNIKKFASEQNNTEPWQMNNVSNPENSKRIIRKNKNL